MVIIAYISRYKKSRKDEEISPQRMRSGSFDTDLPDLENINDAHANEKFSERTNDRQNSSGEVVCSQQSDFFLLEIFISVE